MNKYMHHIGDFDKATRHLTRTERSIYRDLIEIYYDTEKPLTLDFDLLCRKVATADEQERTAVQQNLNEFFIKTEKGWYHERCEYEIDLYRNTKSNKSKAGRASAEARRRNKELRLAELNRKSTTAEQLLNPVETEVQQTPTNQQPTTNNHISTTTTPESAFSLKHFSMNETWEPDWKQLQSCVHLYGITVDPTDPKYLDEFRRYWMGRPDKNTHGQWLNKFLSNLKNKSIHEQVTDIRTNRKLKAAEQVGGKDAEGFIERHRNKDWAKEC